MKPICRRAFVKYSVGAGLSWTVPCPAIAGQRAPRTPGPNDEIRVAVIGLGGINTVGGVGGRGRQLIARLLKVAGVRVAAICEVDRAILTPEVQAFKDRGQQVLACADMRKVLDNPNIDAVVIASPNHWHALATIWACQAGKDVYVEKPFSYNIWEGRQMIAATRRHGRIVQVGTQRRSSPVLREAIGYLRSGKLGAIRCSHALVYRARDGIGKVTSATPVPSTLDYDLWCGPTTQAPVMRKQLHYDWHWVWSTGNGEIGNNGAHMIDVARWALGHDGPPPRAISVGGRFGFNDDGETPNTQIALLDYRPAPLICEIRNLRSVKTPNAMGKFRRFDRGIVVDCEGGYFAGDSSGGAIFDAQDHKIKDLVETRKAQDIEVDHVANFIEAMRSRKAENLQAEAAIGHASAACCHMANVSHRLGRTMRSGQILETIRDSAEMADAFERCCEYLRNNGVDLEVTPALAGPWVSLDAEQGRFIGQFGEQANQIDRREYRPPFVVPALV